jgi:hypothetical protein
MADLGFDFDPNSVPDDDRGYLLPAGQYKAIIAASDVLPTKKGDGKRLSLEWQIIDGPLTGRKLYEHLNIDNPNQVAMKIAHQSLKKIVEACGVKGFRDSAQLHNIPVYIGVAQKARKDDPTTIENQITSYSDRPKDASGPAPAPQWTPPANTAAPSPQYATAQSAVAPPWQR